MEHQGRRTGMYEDACKIHASGCNVFSRYGERRVEESIGGVRGHHVDCYSAYRRRVSHKTSTGSEACMFAPEADLNAVAWNFMFYST